MQIILHRTNPPIAVHNIIIDIYISIHRNKKTAMKKYKQNLQVIGNSVYSYGTQVAEIVGNELRQLGYWSMTTQKHINYVANEMGLKLVKP